mmetsp:Transcript_22225/g.32316  ORF Transcript_22225/g.32316 Transcript_22225/m.32316 type:complete len:640 (-) Transcript_22225:71-1990(-)
MEEESSEGNNASSAYELHTSPTPLERQAVSLPSRRNKHEDDEEECNSYDCSEDCSEDSDDDEEEEMSVKELMYAVNSYHTIAQPVTITMVLAAMAVVYINTQDTIEQGAAQLASTYTVFSLDTDSDSKSTTLAKSFANALVMVCFICALTFVIVILYKFRFMRCLIAYMVYSSAMLLGVLGGVLFDVAIEKYRLPVDTFSFLFSLYNFALVGVVAIFYQTGIPPFLTRAYLVATSVILSWQLSHFDDWTAWTLLIMLALYDLCAVLTPCGPLKALVNLMSKEDAPAMPGLLYEAQLPTTSTQPSQQQLRSISQVQTSSSARSAQASNNQQTQQTISHAESQSASYDAADATDTNLPSTYSDTSYNTDTSHPKLLPASSSETTATHSTSMSHLPTTPPPTQQRTVTIPLAIAKIYKLPLLTTTTTPAASTNDNHSSSSPSRSTATSKRKNHFSRRRHSSGVSTSPLLEQISQEEEEEEEEDDDNANTYNVEDPPFLSTDAIVPFDPTKSYTPKQLRSMVTAVLPANGGRIEQLKSSSSKTNSRRKVKYAVYDRHGQLKRIMLVNKEGRVFEEIQSENGHDDDDDSLYEEEANSIKLGLVSECCVLHVCTFVLVLKGTNLVCFILYIVLRHRVISSFTQSW